MPIIDTAVYVDGVRTPDPPSLDVVAELTRERGGLAWIGMYRPTPDELAGVADEFSLNATAVEDAHHGHQRSKLDRHSDDDFVVLKPARYIDVDERVDIGELHVFVAPDAVITVRHAESPDLAAVRRRLEGDPELLALGSRAVLYAILDEVVDEYAPVLAGLENDIDEIEDELFAGDNAVSRRIYELSREVIELQRAVQPLPGIIRTLSVGVPDGRLRDSFGDVLDHALRVGERVDTFRAVLQNALQVNATLVTQRQNTEMRALSEASLVQSNEVRKISSWAAILFAPTLVGTIYGMNFTVMPELDEPWGYPAALAAMLATSVGLFAIFRARRWL